MFYFLRLLLAHFLADFPFQFNAIFRMKLKGFTGIIPHALIVVFFCILLSWPYLHLPMVWLFIIFIGAVHLLQDSLKLKIKTQSYSCAAYVADQILHVATFALLFLTDLRNLQPPEGQSLLVRLYSDSRLTLFLIALIVASYNGYFLIRCIKDNYLERANYSGFEKWYGILERALIVSLFLFPGRAFLPLSIALMFFRPLIFSAAGKRLGLHPNFPTIQEMLLSWMIGIASGSLLL